MRPEVRYSIGMERLFMRFCAQPEHRDDPNFVNTFVGSRVRKEFYSSEFLARNPLDGFPEYSEEFFEWIDLLEAIEEAEDLFTMIELGAGHGRWLVAGAVAARSRGLNIRLVGVEAESNHFAMMRQHFIDNDIDPNAHTLIPSAVTSDGKPAYFTQGHSHEWWGQSVLPSADYGFGNWPHAKVERVEGISLSTILAPLERVDLIDLDIQGAEFDVLASAKDNLPKVKHIHIGTHGPEIEKDLIALFSDLGWTARYCYHCGTIADTDYGPIRFLDGVQSWINPPLMGCVAKRELDQSRSDPGGSA